MLKFLLNSYRKLIDTVSKVSGQIVEIHAFSLVIQFLFADKSETNLFMPMPMAFQLKLEIQ